MPNEPSEKGGFFISREWDDRGAANKPMKIIWYFLTLFWYPAWKKRLHDDI